MIEGIISNAIEYAKSSPYDFTMKASCIIGGTALLVQGIYSVCKSVKQTAKKHEEKMENECITEYTLDQRTGDTVSVKRYIPEVYRV